MGKGKLQKFADMASYANVFEFPVSLIGHGKPGDETVFRPDICGHWREQYFHNDHPLVLELGCGRGEYTVGLARRHPDVNYIGVDIKGARMWTGATQALREGLQNVAFLRTNIEIIDRFFAPGEVQQLWLTFSDPQMKNPRKRLTSTYFLERYRRFLQDRGVVHLKTDSRFLFTYTQLMADSSHLPVVCQTDDLYHDVAAQASLDPETLAIQTYYESMWLERGLPIRYMQFLLPQEGTLTEPDAEIPLDDYRSYHRSKRSPKTAAK